MRAHDAGRFQAGKFRKTVDGYQVSKGIMLIMTNRSKLNGFARDAITRSLMRRKYRDRKHITVYLDLAEYDKLREIAGGDGRISEWARETLVAKLGDNSGVREKPRVRVAKRGTGAPERSEASVPATSGQAGPYEAGGELGRGSAPIVKLCRHKLSSCTVCG